MTTARAYVVASADAPAFWQIRNLWRVVATGIQTGGSFCAVDQLVNRDGGGPPAHTHTQDEGMYIISGHVSYKAGGMDISADPGSFVLIPKHSEHSFVVDEPDTQLLNFYLPAGFEMLLMGVAVPAQSNELPPPETPVPLPPRAMVQRLSDDYGAFAVSDLPFADHPTPENMQTKATPGAAVQPALTNAATAPAFWHERGLWTVLADGAATQGNYCLFEATLPQGTAGPAYLHAQSDEVFYVLDGEIEFFLGDRTETAASQSLVFLPRGTVHSYRVTSTTAHVLNLHTPAGFERLVSTVGEPTDVRTLPGPSWTAPEIPEAQRRSLLSDIGLATFDLTNGR